MILFIYWAFERYYDYYLFTPMMHYYTPADITPIRYDIIIIDDIFTAISPAGHLMIDDIDYYASATHYAITMIRRWYADEMPRHWLALLPWYAIADEAMTAAPLSHWLAFMPLTPDYWWPACTLPPLDFIWAGCIADEGFLSSWASIIELTAIDD